MTMSAEEEEKGEINLKLTMFEDKEIDWDFKNLLTVLGMFTI